MLSVFPAEMRTPVENYRLDIFASENVRSVLQGAHSHFSYDFFRMKILFICIEYCRREFGKP